jgi:ammonia channel protein AmtB
MFNGANTGFMLLAAALVMIMTPGLAFFYGGLVGRSNTLTIMIQSFASMGITTVMWWVVGYSLCFSGGGDSVYGNFEHAFLRGVEPGSIYAPSGIPTTVLIAYQMMFAIITPALITGAFTNRVTFKAYLIFLVVWQLLVYYPFVNPAGGSGLVHGTAAFFGKQIASAVGCSIYAFAFTYVMLKVIDRIAPVRVGEEGERGLDEFMHGENAYDTPPVEVVPAA